MNEPVTQFDLGFQSWRKSTRSQGNDNQCVEVGFSTNAVGVRDTKSREAGLLAFSPAAWSEFVAGAPSITRTRATR